MALLQVTAGAKRLVASSEMRDPLAAQRLQAYPIHAPDFFAAYIRSELANWRAMAKAAGVEGIQ